MKLIITFVLLSLVISLPAQEQPKPFLGVNHQIIDELPNVAGAPFAQGGIEITSVQDGTPASDAGLLPGDIIVSIDGYDLNIPSEKIGAKFAEILQIHIPGDELPLTVLRMEIVNDLSVNHQSTDPSTYLLDPPTFVYELPNNSSIIMKTTKRWIVKNIVVILGVRNEFQSGPLPDISETDLGKLILPPAPLPYTDWQPWVDEVIKTWDLEEDFSDLLQRLIKVESGNDGTRLPAIAATHRSPYFLELFGRHFTDEILDSKKSILNVFCHPDLTIHLTGNLQLADSIEPAFLPVEATEDEFLIWFESEMAPLIQQLEQVYAPLTEEERKFFMEHRFELTDAFSDHIYLHADRDRGRLARNLRLLEIGNKINLDSLFLSANSIGQFILKSEKQVFVWMSLNPDISFIPTRWGKIGFGTELRDRWDNPEFKFIYDPGGEDFYANGVGTAESFDELASWIVDRQGNDAYQSTSQGAQGSGLPGVGILIDQQGDDTYIGLRWAQGTGYLGVGVLMDDSGNDNYHGTQFIQGVGLFGLGVLVDQEGDDRYNGSKHAQGVGLTKGLGMLIDYAGNDNGYCTGLQPTNYGDPGIFDAWSQGCGMGFRGNASGGIGIVLDLAGIDRWEAGNFSQGGGYYYGLGIFRSGGAENDTYIASRYGQGFSAHQAAGLFIEEGGNDFYTTRQGVVSGLAWDECVTIFLDEGGNDYYNGGTGFSLGASAHNSFCIFIDKGGMDRYYYAPGPARAGVNNYHGGSSFSFFVDDGLSRDIYSNDQLFNNTERAWPEYGVFRDGKGKLPLVIEHPR